MFEFLKSVGFIKFEFQISSDYELASQGPI